MISEADAEDYKQQDREEREERRRERIRSRQPNIGEPCERCGGRGHFWHLGLHEELCYCQQECPRCLGTGVQP